MRGVEAWKGVLRAALRQALLGQDAAVVAVMRETLAAIDNAEAVEVSAAPPAGQSGRIAGGVVGLGAGEVPRRVLSPAAVTTIVEGELEARLAAAATYTALGKAEEAARLRLQADLLASLLTGGDPPAPLRPLPAGPVALVALAAARIDRGDLYWIPPVETGGSPAGPAHPHVVVQDDVFNHARIPTVVVCALTTNLQRATEPGNVLLEVGEGNLPRQSVVVVSQIDSVEKTRLGERIGSLSATRVEQILAGLRFQQASFFER